MQGVGRVSECFRGHPGKYALEDWMLQPPAFEGGRFPLDERQAFLMWPKHQSGDL